MSFHTLLKSLDDLLFEVVSWLIFYPVTLWRALRHPLKMMRYADSELGETVDRQYPDVMSPPLFLLVTLMLSHGVELALVGNSPIVASNTGLDALVSDDTNLIALRILGFSLYPLAMALRMVRVTGKPPVREALKLPFFAQCYAAAPLALLMSVGSTLMRCVPDAAKIAGLACVVIAIVWFLSMETVWFRRAAELSWRRALINALIAYVGATLVMVAISMMM
jgi:hypothetical protein